MRLCSQTYAILQCPRAPRHRYSNLTTSRDHPPRAQYHFTQEILCRSKQCKLSCSYYFSLILKMSCCTSQNQPDLTLYNMFCRTSTGCHARALNLDETSRSYPRYVVNSFAAVYPNSFSIKTTPTPFSKELEPVALSCHSFRELSGRRHRTGAGGSSSCDLHTSSCEPRGSSLRDRHRAQ